MENQLMNTDSILESLKIKALNKMQLDTQIALQDHNNLVLLSNTGTGKTLAFLIPLIQSIDIELKKPGFFQFQYLTIKLNCCDLVIHFGCLIAFY